MSNYVIETDRLTKRFGDVLAVNCVELRVKQGEIYGFLGLNGAGKTTTIRALLEGLVPLVGAGLVQRSRRSARRSHGNT